MRKTIEEVETNMAYRWFLGYGFQDKVPHFSTFGKNYERRFKDTDLFEQIFYRILMTAANKKLISAEHVFGVQNYKILNPFCLQTERILLGCVFPSKIL